MPAPANAEWTGAAGPASAKWETTRSSPAPVCISGKNPASAEPKVPEPSSFPDAICAASTARTTKSAVNAKEVSVERLREIYRELIAKGAHNINLVTPMHFSDAVLESLDAPLPVPVVCNTNGYESVENLKRFEGKFQIYLPDVKYSDDTLAERFSSAKDYFKTARRAVREMLRQTGSYRIDEETGLMRRGVVIRHLLLPNHVENTLRVIDWVAETFEPGEVMFSLMRQYIPHGRAAEFADLNRKVTDEEYKRVEDHLFESGIEDGFVQDQESASDSFIPSFDGTGV